jgi:DNA-binding transcriptional regulator YhcF (GntR family)
MKYSEVTILKIDFDNIKPIYLQIAEEIEGDIISGNLKEGQQAYSQLIIARELNVNPATAAKGITILVQKGILEKQRGLSMIVSTGARKKLLSEKKDKNFMELIKQLISEANKLELPQEKVIQIIKEVYSDIERKNENG